METIIKYNNYYDVFLFGCITLNSQEKILSYVSNKINIPILSIKSRIRNKVVVFSRVLYTILCGKNLSGISLNEIGNLINRDHATILHYKKMYENLKYDYEFKRFLKNNNIEL
jgi:chromosomal replication initiation ATPase DnaA